MFLVSGLATLAIVLAILIGLTKILFGVTTALVLGVIAVTLFGLVFWKAKA